MADLVSLIAEVLKEHMRATNHEEWDGLRWHQCDCGRSGSGFVEESDHATHVAGVVADRLNLQEETNTYSGVVTSTSPRLRRWVSGWTEEQQ